LENKLLVVAAFLRDSQGRILLARRPPGKVRAGLWEFPGGKVHAGESPEEALRRELREELGLEARIGRELARLTHTYPDLTIELLLFEAFTEDTPRAREGQEWGWFSPQEIEKLDLAAADRKLCSQLSGERLPKKIPKK